MPPTALDHVDLVLTAAETGTPLSPGTVQWLACGFRTIAERRRVRLEAALGITTRGGVGGLSKRQRQDKRNELLRDLRVRLFPSMQPREAARAILNMYERRAGQTGDPATDAAHLVDALIAIGLKMPEERRLADILGGK